MRATLPGVPTAGISGQSDNRRAGEVKVRHPHEIWQVYVPPGTGRQAGDFHVTLDLPIDSQFGQRGGDVPLDPPPSLREIDLAFLLAVERSIYSPPEKMSRSKYDQHVLPDDVTRAAELWRADSDVSLRSQDGAAPVDLYTIRRILEHSIKWGEVTVVMTDGKVRVLSASRSEGDAGTSVPPYRPKDITAEVEAALTAGGVEVFRP